MRQASCAFIAAGGNRHPAAADVDERSGILAFGADRNIALWKPCGAEAQTGIQTLLAGHTDVVNAIKFLPLEGNRDSVLLSGSADAKIRIWRRPSPSSIDLSNASVLLQEFVCWKTLEGHGKSINIIAVLPERSLFVSGAADSEIRVWRLSMTEDDLRVDLIQTITLTPKFFPLSLALSSIPESDAIVLAVAGSRPFVQVFVSHHQGGDFELTASLTGHEGWIRSLDFCRTSQDLHGLEDDILLASASQDKYIRLWRFHKGEALPAAIQPADDPLLGALGPSLSNKAHRFKTGDANYSITFEALLVGHEDWIYNARWCVGQGGLRLLSASADNSLAIWQPDEGSGVWTCTVRLGEISAQKGATTATGSTGGFWIGLWHNESRAVLSLGRTGGWRLWSHDESQDLWTQVPAVSGHTREVTGLAWANDGSYLLSTSSDQTTRMFAPLKSDQKTQAWHELARPQIHGYDLNCIDTISNTRFISGADEKLLRVFDEPKAVADLLSAVCGITPESNGPMPEAANIPVLGLSNKVVEPNESNGDEADADTQQTEHPPTSPPENKSLSESGKPPLEDHLSRHLLWPEIEKLYGHGYEISAVASSNDGTTVATACRASSTDHAVIRLYRTSDWRELKPSLVAHSLTVTRLQFSPDDSLLLSVGRDRQCALFARATPSAGAAAGESQQPAYALVASDAKAHARMLLDAAWAPPSATGAAFATAGRDKAVHVWRFAEGRLARRATVAAAAPVTAVAFAPRAWGRRLVLACGLDDGTVLLRDVDSEDLALGERCVELGRVLAPSRAVTRLAWRPGVSPSLGGEDSEVAQLAVASQDCSVRVLDVDIGKMLDGS